MAKKNSNALMFAGVLVMGYGGYLYGKKRRADKAKADVTLPPSDQVVLCQEYKGHEICVSKGPEYGFTWNIDGGAQSNVWGNKEFAMDHAQEFIDGAQE